MATYAVGDIQGCLSALQQLLQRVNFNPSDQLWCVGDLVNRGSQSLETLRYLKRLGPQVKIVLGNHDLHLLALYYQYRHQNLDITQHPYLAPVITAPDSQQLLGWLQQQPLLYIDNDLHTVMTHAGIPPCWSLAQAQALANEVSDLLQSPQADEFFACLYGNQPDTWHAQLTGYPRWRCIVNYLTRMRFIGVDGQLEFSSTGNLTHAPDGFAAWFSYPSQVTYRQVFGHWAALNGQTYQSQVINLDMGCVWGGHLKLVRLQDEQVFTVSCRDLKRSRRDANSASTMAIQ